MSTVLTWETESTSLEKTLEIAALVGQKLKGGEVIELVSDLGGGKTVFVKGVAKGMGVKDIVGSPSFTLSSEYKAGDLTLHHYDFYRLGEPGLMTNTLGEVLGKPESVVAIEWADLVVDTVLPSDRLSVHIRAIDDTSRHLRFSYPEHLVYLIPSKA
jgi:tRNA threonylcarbamoyladenosine biosynthesis protein TsaE